MPGSPPARRLCFVTTFGEPAPASRAAC